jgi:hypothetical protein
MTIRFTCALATVLALAARIPDARAQGAAPAAPEPAPPAASPGPETAPPAAAPIEVAPPSAPPPTVALATPAPPSSSGFVLELQASGFFESLDGGFFLGGRYESGTILGVGINVAGDRLGTDRPFGVPLTAGSSSGFGFSLYPGLRFVLARSSERRVDLVGDVDVGVTKYFASDHISLA